MGGRMDTIQAAILNVKLKYYAKDLALRQKAAEKYSDQFKTQHSKFIIPVLENDRTSAWAQYSIRVDNRDEVQARLKEQGIPTAVHYPIPLHLQKCFSYLEYQKDDFPVSENVSQSILSLPMNPYLNDEEINYICSQL